MPSSIIAAGIAIFEAISVAQVVSFVATVALSYVLSSLNKPDGIRGTTQTDPGVRAQTPPDTTTPLPVIYGDAYLGGRFVDACLRLDQRVMYYVQAISCISPNGQFSFDRTKFYYGDRLITFDSVEQNKVVSLTDGAGNVDTSISSWLYISVYTSDANGNITAFNTQGKMPWEYLSDGITGETSLLMGDRSGLATSQQWTATGRRMNGTAFAIVRLSYSRDAGTTSLQPITYHCSHYLNNAGVAKPGDVWYDYMINNIYGCAILPEFVDSTSVTALNAYSDQLITFNNYSGGTSTQPRYRINGVVDTSKAVLKNIDDIMTACDSWLRYEASTGLWSVTINQAGTPALALNDNNIIGSIVCGTTDLAQGINVVEAKFPDSTNRDQYNYVNEAVPPDLLYPNEPVNKQTLTYELVNNSVQALYLANRVLEQGREDLTVTINTTYVGIQLSAGDIVSITNAQYGWNAKLFRCYQVQEAFVDGSLGAQLQLGEYNAQVYDNFNINQFTPAPNTDTPSAGYFGNLSAPVVTNSYPYEATPSFIVGCIVPSVGRVTGVILYYTTKSSPTSTDWQLWGNQTLTDSQPFVQGSSVYFNNINLSPATYYFAYKVYNEVYSSQISPISVAFSWNPNPGNASTFILSFAPATIQVPFINNIAVLDGISYRLFGSNNTGQVDFVTAQTDADSSFVNNTWRIGDSENTGYGAIVASAITINNPTDGGNYALFGAPTAMLGDNATVTVPARYKDSAGNIRQSAAASIQFVRSNQGADGNQVATAVLYQWSPSVPPNPSGTSTFTWSNGTNSAYTGGGGWSVTVGNNPQTPLLQLYTATKQVTAKATDTTTTVSWSSGYTIQSVGANGANGVQTAQPTVYQWAVTIPSGPVGTSLYTWASSSFSPVPSGWSSTPGTAPAGGYTLWGATVQLVDSATASATSIIWTSASITARGYSGTNGASSRICYSKTTLSSLSPTPTTIITSGGGSFPPNGSWGSDTVWQSTPPAINAGESVWQSDGIYDQNASQTIWNVPYLSALKVGSLSAITTNTGNLTVTGTIQSGNANISGTTLTGNGAVIYNDGRFGFGNSGGNIVYNGSQTTINGALVATGNVQINGINVPGITSISSGTLNTDSNTVWLSLNITTNVACYVYGSCAISLGFPAGVNATEHHLLIDGNLVSKVVSGPFIIQSVALGGALYLAAGTHNLQYVAWCGGDYPPVYILSATLFGQGIQR